MSYGSKKGGYDLGVLSGGFSRTPISVHHRKGIRHCKVHGCRRWARPRPNSDWTKSLSRARLKQLLARTNETRAMNNFLIAIRVDLFHFRYERHGEQLNKTPLFPAVLGSVKVRTRLVGRIGLGVRVSANFPKIPSRGSVPKMGLQRRGFSFGSLASYRLERSRLPITMFVTSYWGVQLVQDVEIFLFTVLYRSV